MQACPQMQYKIVLIITQEVWYYVHYANCKYLNHSIQKLCILLSISNIAIFHHWMSPNVNSWSENSQNEKLVTNCFLVLVRMAQSCRREFGEYFGMELQKNWDRHINIECEGWRQHSWKWFINNVSEVCFGLI